MHRQGSFDTIRLIAALAVFHSHMFALSGRVEPVMPGMLKLGAVAVAMFFAISGYLVTQSAFRRSLPSFAVARLVRILPGLALCCLVVIGIGAIASDLPARTYFTSPGTWLYLRNVAVFWTPMQDFLPGGVFEANPFVSVNGSLWTLRYEILCYVALACAALFGREGVKVAIAGSAVFATATLFAPAGTLIVLLDAFDARFVGRLGCVFALGAAFALMPKDLRARAALVLGFVALLARSDPVSGQLLASLAYGALAIWLGTAFHADRVVTRGWDVSYGVYIYAFPMQQFTVWTFGP